MQNTATIERRVDELGRIVLPAEYRTAMGIGKDATLSITFVDDSIVLKRISPSCRICHSSKHVDPKLKVCVECINVIRKS